MSQENVELVRRLQVPPDVDLAALLAMTARRHEVNHLDALIEQLSKGVHVDVVRDEAKQAYVQTWAFIAHVAQVHSDD